MSKLSIQDEMLGHQESRSRRAELIISSESRSLSSGTAQELREEINANCLIFKSDSGERNHSSSKITAACHTFYKLNKPVWRKNIKEVEATTLTTLNVSRLTRDDIDN